MKILAYAAGGGLGHLTRLRAALHTLALEDAADVMVVSASPAVGDPAVAARRWHAAAVPGDLHADPLGFERWLRDLAHRLQPDLVVVDAFPLGLLGELLPDTFPPRVPRWHLSRLLQWHTYVARVRTPGLRFDYERVFLLEEPGDIDHAAWLASAGPVEPLPLLDPPAAADPDIPPGRCLVVHAGPPREVERLRALARAACREEPFVVRSYPAWPSFDDAAFLVTGAGFNVVRQARTHRHKHLIVPFARPLDDQYLRALRARREVHRAEHLA